ncbi:Non-specific serine/threonine protein kinase protein [Dioscorea alata]|uniref:Non-specific serine/threonine protein kinase protein n=1 Tax=Dioscorea alata TaxID=55571 RepID=A0ACB7TZQ1_DIOAL|nr:Non-specific serine/threonine protein kinase protein [Dioscorea alata]
MEELGGRLIGDYMLGPKIGSGSFAVVWHGRHRHSGMEVAVKEIDKKQLSPKVHDSLLKEIDILRHVSHPNIVRFHHAVQTDERIFLVLEYCDGGDLAAYIQRHGRVSEALARHYMRQLASGLQVLRENNLIHRDLKPQNLLLSTNGEAPVLKIGDFGFARYLMPQGLADTLCGSPLYMAPEIIQNKKYDAKADLWSVGAILYQLVTGKPPFDGASQFQLFQNILASSELKFPQEVLADLHPDVVDLCKRLLRQEPVERLTFEEFFNHKFLAVERPSECVESVQGTANDKVGMTPDCAPSSSSNARSVQAESMDHKLFGLVTSKDSLEAIEQEYVLVHRHLASLEILASSIEGTSWKDSSGAKLPSKGTSVQLQKDETYITSLCQSESGRDNLPSHSSVLQQSFAAEKPQGASSLHPSTRLQFLYHYIRAITDVMQEKLTEGLHLESFSIELVALAVWREALRVCTCWVSSAKGKALDTCLPSIAPQTNDSSFPYTVQEVDFWNPSSVCSWVEHGFINAYELAEKIAENFQNIDGDIMMPDAMEILFQAALCAGKSGAADELMGNKIRAMSSYSRATTLFTFIVFEAMSLPLNPPFVLSSSDKQRIQRYIMNLRAHMNRSLMAEPVTDQTKDSTSK